MSKPDGMYWTCKPLRREHEPEAMVEPWKGAYETHVPGGSDGIIWVGDDPIPTSRDSSRDNAWAGDKDLHEKASDAWRAYSGWLNERKEHYEEQYDHAVRKLEEAQRDEDDAAKLKEILDDKR